MSPTTSKQHSDTYKMKFQRVSKTATKFVCNSSASICNHKIGFFSFNHNFNNKPAVVMAKYLTFYF